MMFQKKYLGLLLSGLFLILIQQTAHTTPPEQIIQLIVGDSGGDGHEKTEKFNIYSNLSPDAIRKAEKKAAKILGFNFSQEIAAEYDDNRLPKNKLKILRDHGIEVKIEDEDAYRDENDVGIDVDTYVFIWLGIIKLGNPLFHYRLIEESADYLDIGGYGLFE